MSEQRLTPYLLIVIVCASCGLAEEPLRVDGDPELEALLDADAGEPSDVGQSDVGEDAGGEDVGPPPDELGYVCEPSCLEDQFCGPGDVCYERRQRCVASGETCNPITTPPSPTYVCEALFGDKIGVCRQLCDLDDEDSCLEGKACGALYEGSSTNVCRIECGDDQDACGPLDSCVGPRGFGVCRGLCPPYVAGQCPEETMCVAVEGQRGYCDAAGELGLHEVCEEASCSEGLRCTDTGGDDRCLRQCAPSALQGEPGSCGEGEACESLGSFDLGVCRAACDLFDPVLSCPVEWQACVVINDRAGVCAFRGRIARGNRCQSNAQCAAPLQCLRSEDGAQCERLCLRSADEGEEGACPSGQSCAMTGFGNIGVCR